MLFRPDYNDVIEAFDSGVSREAKTAAWESIAHVLRTSFAESKPRSVEELKRKWNNLETAVKKDIGWCPSISAEATVPETSHNFKKDNPCLPGEIIPGSCDSETLDEKSLKSLYDQVQRGESRLQDIDFEVTDEMEGVVGDIEEGLDVIGRREEEDRQSEQYSSYYYHRRYYYDGPGSPPEVQQPSPSTYSRRSRSRSPPNSRDSRKRLGKRKRDLSPERRSARLQQLASRKGPTEPEQSTSNPLVVQGRPEVSPTVSKVDALAKAVVSKQVIRHLTKWISNGLSTTESKTIQGDYKLEFEKNSFSLNPPVLDDWMAHRVKNGSKLKLVGVAEKLWLSAQLKVMDIATPLISLYANLLQSAEHQKHGPVIQALKAALQQWARAYYHISRRSRHNVLSATLKHFYSSLSYLTILVISFGFWETMEPMTTDTGVPLVLKYDYQETQTIWKTRMDTQDQLWSKNRTSLYQSIVESLPVCKEAACSNCRRLGSTTVKCQTCRTHLCAACDKVVHSKTITHQ
ncbi:Uncharacterized protein APZ42_027689 [Daphnia magna]|uniref:Regulatory protein zeste n=1 Tax=Daphnia magna TaxID=35525 RepID=A0A164R737_9CRUS|nr:Uncharacterized protein APZ42_027689 [Daphnia magna]